MDGDHNQTAAHRNEVVSQMDMQDCIPYPIARGMTAHPWRVAPTATSKPGSTVMRRSPRSGAEALRSQVLHLYLTLRTTCTSRWTRQPLPVRHPCDHRRAKRVGCVCPCEMVSADQDELQEYYVGGLNGAIVGIYPSTKVANLSLRKSN